MRKILRRHEVSSLSPARSGKLKFTDAQLSAFSRQVVGRIVLPQDPSYNNDRQPFMCAFHHFPQIIVYCTGNSDVLACIRFASEVGLKVTCRAGGHSAAGFSVNDEMVIDVSGIHYVCVDPDSETAAVGGGANFAQVYAELDLFGLHVPGGGCESVCVGGYMQGGGYSFTSQMFGMNCDNVVGVKVATADGRIVSANENQHQDLFWAVRGGTGNNFGVLLEVEYRVRKLGPLRGFGFKWPISTDAQAEAASNAAAIWQKYFTGADVPDNLGNQAFLAYTKESEDAAQFSPYFVIRGMYNGSEAACLDALKPLLEHAPDAGQHRDVWREGTYSTLNDYLLNYPTGMPADVPLSARSIAKSHIADRHLSPDEWRSLVEFFRQSPSSDNFVGLEGYGGAINAVPPEATAFWHREGTMDMFLYSFWIIDENRDEAEAYLSAFDHVAGPLSNGHSYQNYPNRQLADFGEAYFGGNLPRLVDVKKTYDPGDLFAFPQGLLNA